MTTLIAKTVTKACVPITILFSISLLLAGHNNPGGGFIGGVMFASAISLMYVVFGLKYIRSAFKHQWEKWFALGLILAASTGFGAILFGHNFLRSSFMILDLPFVGEIELVSAALFDTGVYLVVLGSILHIFKSTGDDE
ncbi:monovalent cation/H+ antiporter subunit B [Methanolobus sp. ZRKC3]|uniref:monovalent cation/H+ antiporter subunit B n=1 Tax=Methanolobus sp. ZRKC3 TaxID=3125786 RepID=UPI003251EFBF